MPTDDFYFLCYNIIYVSFYYYIMMFPLLRALAVLKSHEEEKLPFDVTPLEGHHHSLYLVTDDWLFFICTRSYNWVVCFFPRFSNISSGNDSNTRVSRFTQLLCQALTEARGQSLLRVLTRACGQMVKNNSPAPCIYSKLTRDLVFKNKQIWTKIPPSCIYNIHVPDSMKGHFMVW